MVWPPLSQRTKLAAITPLARETGERSSHLSSAIEQLARAGEQAGFSVEEMIEMLNAGISIGALLDVISYSLSHEASESTQHAVEESTSTSAPMRIQERRRDPHGLLRVQES
jgi:hypothetical protein